MLEGFRLIHRFRVPFCDVDMMRHVNNVAYARWAETLRTEYFGDVLQERIGGATGIILARTEIVYERPIAYRENVAMGGRVGKIGGEVVRVRHGNLEHGLGRALRDDRMRARGVRLRGPIARSWYPTSGERRSRHTRTPPSRSAKPARRVHE